MKKYLSASGLCFLFFAQMAKATDYQACNTFLAANESGKYVHIGADGSVKVSNALAGKVIHFNRIPEAESAKLNHYEILISRIKNKAKNAHPQFLEDIVNVWLNAQNQVSLIERSNNYNGASWAGNVFHLSYNAQDQCGVTEEDSFSYDMKTHEKTQSVMFNTNPNLTSKGVPAVPNAAVKLPRAQ